MLVYIPYKPTDNTVPRITRRARLLSPKSVQIGNPLRSKNRASQLVLSADLYGIYMITSKGTQPYLGPLEKVLLEKGFIRKRGRSALL